MDCIKHRRVATDFIYTYSKPIRQVAGNYKDTPLAQQTAYVAAGLGLDAFIRLSFGKNNTEEERHKLIIEYYVAAIKSAEEMMEYFETSFKAQMEYNADNSQG